jgi:hypothetical protein
MSNTKQTAMKTIRQLKAMATQMGCRVEDDKDNSTLYIHAEGGKAWDDGCLSSLAHPYGSWGSYKPEWRLAAINEAFTRLSEMGRPNFDAVED